MLYIIKQMGMTEIFSPKNKSHHMNEKCILWKDKGQKFFAPDIAVYKTFC